MSFCGSSQEASNTGTSSTGYGWQNPLGPTSIGAGGKPNFSATGAPQLASQLFSYLGSSMPQMQQAGQNYATALGTAASAPGWGAAQSNATGTAAGDYLAGSPELNQALARNQATAGAAAQNEVARQQSEMAKNGMAWGTPSQEAAQSTVAGANANAANTNAQTYLQNYQGERAAQNNAGSMLAQATGTPLSYLSAVPGAYTSGLTPAANLLSGLSSGGQVYQTSGAQGGYQAGTYNPSTGSDIMNGISSL